MKINSLTKLRKTEKLKNPGNVTKFQVGDDVYGDISECGFGGLAEYVCVPENALALETVRKFILSPHPAVPQMKHI